MYIISTQKIINEETQEKKKLRHAIVYTSHVTVSVLGTPGLRKTTLDMAPTQESMQTV